MKPHLFLLTALALVSLSEGASGQTSVPPLPKSVVEALAKGDVCAARAGFATFFNAPAPGEYVELRDNEDALKGRFAKGLILAADRKAEQLWKQGNRRGAANLALASLVLPYYATCEGLVRVPNGTPFTTEDVIKTTNPKPRFCADEYCSTEEMPYVYLPRYFAGKNRRRIETAYGNLLYFLADGGERPWALVGYAMLLQSEKSRAVTWLNYADLLFEAGEMNLSAPAYECYRSLKPPKEAPWVERRLAETRRALDGRPRRAGTRDQRVVEIYDRFEDLPLDLLKVATCDPTNVRLTRDTVVGDTPYLADIPLKIEQKVGDFVDDVSYALEDDYGVHHRDCFLRTWPVTIDGIRYAATGSLRPDGCYGEGGLLDGAQKIFGLEFRDRTVLQIDRGPAEYCPPGQKEKSFRGVIGFLEPRQSVHGFQLSGIRSATVDCLGFPVEFDLKEPAVIAGFPVAEGRVILKPKHAAKERVGSQFKLSESFRSLDIILPIESKVLVETGIALDDQNAPTVDWAMSPTGFDVGGTHVSAYTFTQLRVVGSGQNAHYEVFRAR